MDDKYYLDSYSLDKYQSSFVPSKEVQNSISSIMSAMVSQIAEENSYEDIYQENLQKKLITEQDQSGSTGEDTIDDLFDSFSTNVDYDL